MAVSIKNKIRSGTLFLFLLLLLMGGTGIYFLIKLKNDSKNIIKANYESLDYSHGMQQQLADVPYNSARVASFDSLLKKQEENLTENGERTETQLLRSDFAKLSGSDTAAGLKNDIQKRLQNIIRLNMGMPFSEKMTGRRPHLKRLQM